VTTEVSAVRRTAGAIMSAPAVCVTPETSIWSASALMTVQGTRHLLVADQGRCVGAVDDRTIFAQWPRGPGALRRVPIRSIMRTRITCVFADATVPEVAAAMLSDGVDAVPVVADDGALLGIITSSDVLAAVADSAAVG
jgi:CBS domain-containing protein